jgi:hypothetical protein
VEQRLDGRKAGDIIKATVLSKHLDGMYPDYLKKNIEPCVLEVTGK